MTRQVFAVQDVAAGIYLPPFVAHTEALAMRLFGDLCREPGHDFNRHPGDYTLFRIGTYDDATGVMTSEAAVSFGNGMQHVQPQLEAVNA